MKIIPQFLIDAYQRYFPTPEQKRAAVVANMEFQVKSWCRERGEDPSMAGYYSGCLPSILRKGFHYPTGSSNGHYTEKVMGAPLFCGPLTYGLIRYAEKIGAEGTNVLAENSELLFNRPQLPLAFYHNLRNALAEAHLRAEIEPAGEKEKFFVAARTKMDGLLKSLKATVTKIKEGFDMQAELQEAQVTGREDLARMISEERHLKKR